MLSLPTSTLLVAERFLIEQLAAHGGMGSVYRARDLQSGQPVAVKILHVAHPSVDEVERFTREAHLLASLEHPGIVSYIGHGQMDDGAPFLVMEWLEGLDLQQLLRQRRLSIAESLSLISKATEALAVAHKQGIVHRVPNERQLPSRNHRLRNASGNDREIEKLSALGLVFRRNFRVLAIAS